MAVYKEHLQQPFFDDIKRGAKKFEGRLVKKIWAQLQIGDSIEWWNNEKGYEESFVSVVTSLTKFVTFAEGIKSVGLINVCHRTVT